MALTGELSDLSLAELIEFFCNQRKTGRLKVIYRVGAGYFYLKAGAVVHARFGDLRGIDAVYYALTQTNASFTFSPAFEPPEHSINQPWTSVVLEGLRRMDEGITPPMPSASSIEEAHEGVEEPAADAIAANAAVAQAENSGNGSKDSTEDVKAFGVLLSAAESNSFARRRWHPAMVVAAIVLLVAMVGVPWALYTRKKAAQIVPDASAAPAPSPTETALPTATESQPEVVSADAEASVSTDPAEILRRQREARARERAKALEQGSSSNADAGAKPAVSNPGTATVKSPPVTSNKRATVQVTYDENGRVTAASGGDATALRIARQKRFPPGKPGSATITIPIN